jgi:hypothetical protein
LSHAYSYIDGDSDSYRDAQRYTECYRYSYGDRIAYGNSHCDTQRHA